MANHRNPIGIVVPCHRVVGANGKLTGCRRYSHETGPFGVGKTNVKAGGIIPRELKFHGHYKVFKNKKRPYDEAAGKSSGVTGSLFGEISRFLPVGYRKCRALSSGNSWYNTPRIRVLSCLAFSHVSSEYSRFPLWELCVRWSSRQPVVLLLQTFCPAVLRCCF